MSSVEAAASLFGSSDSGSDLDFLTAPEGPNSASDSPARTGVGDSNELFASQDSAGLFDTDNESATAPSLFETRGEAGTHPHGQNEGHTAEFQAYQPDTGYSYGQETQSAFDSSGGGYASYAEGWYDETGQWHAYEQHEETSATTASNVHSGSVEAPKNDAYTSSYDAYNASSQYTSQTGNTTTPYGYQATYGPPSSSAQSTYDPYKPATPIGQTRTSAYGTTVTTSPYDPYKPSGASPLQSSPSPYAPPAQSPYDPYKPVTSNSLSPPVVPPPALPHSSTFTSASSLIPSPSVIDTSKLPASPYRPSTANAYDPPLPAIKPKKSLTASAFQYQSSPHAPDSATSPPPPPARKVSSPPQITPSLPSGPPPTRASMHSPPRVSTVSYAQTVAPAERTSSPYDPPISRAYVPSSSQSYGTYGPARPHINGQHISPISPSAYSHPGQREQASDSTGLPPKNTQHDAMSHHEDNYYSGTVDNAPVPTAQDVGQLGDVEQPRNDVYSAVHNVAEAPEGRTSSRPASSASRRATSQSPASERRVRMSPDVTARSAGSHRTVSPPVSESGRSQQGSVGRGSPLSVRARTSFVGQSFSAIDEQSPQHSEPYGFMARRSLDRTDSPEAGSVGSHRSYGVPPATVSTSSYPHENRNAVDLSSDTARINGSPVSPSQHSQPAVSATSAPYEPYKPSVSEINVQKYPTEPPLPAPPPASDPYNPAGQFAPLSSTYQKSELRERSMSNISSFSASSPASYDTYAPSAHAIKRHGQEFSPQAANSYASPPVPPSLTSFTTVPRSSLESSYSPPPVSGPYAPSPSLLGTNDPLGRASAKVPIVSFGFAGKLVTCFHSPPTLDTGFDVALSSRKCTDVHIRPVDKAIPEYALNVSSASYPGPLFGDPGSPVTTLVRTAASGAKSKTKKAKVVAYLTERVEELERGSNYLSPGSAEKRRADGKLALVRLLRALVEYDGQLHGSATAETAAREALLPRLANSDAAGANAYLNAPTGASLATGTFGSATSDEKPLAEYAVRCSALETLQGFLLRGEKRKAYHYALDERMWAHAMVISSGVDKDAFKEVVNEFIRTELGVKADPRPDIPVTNGFESLRLAYSLYSGQSSTAVQHLLPMKSLQAGPSLTLQPPTPINHMTPLSPNFPPPSVATNISPEILSQWPEYAAMLFSGQMGAESSSALTTLGDYLISNDWVEAAHCCYLLSPQSSPIGGVGAPSVRIVLVGAHSPHRNPSFFTDPDAFIFSEILEFALSLHSPAKGQEAFPGFPHLQVYRFIRALQLAEIGQASLAKRYCDAIMGAASRHSAYLSPLFSDQLRELYNRLNGVPELDKAQSWIGGKLAKPSLDGLGGWLEGTLSKFVAGEEGSSSPSRGEHSTPENSAYANAFSRYSNISSTANSRGASPAPSFVNGYVPYNSLPARSGSASGTRSVPNYSPNVHQSPATEFDRPGSARNTPPPQRVLSADSGVGTVGQQTLSQMASNHGYGGLANGHSAPNGTAVHEEEKGGPQGGGGWWSAVYGDNDNATPTASSFSNVDNLSSETDSGGSGFISLMDNYNSYTPSPSAATFTNKKLDEPDDLEDDLGIGNSSMKKKKETTEGHEDDAKAEKEEEKKEEPKKPAKSEVSASTSWFGRWFSRPSSAKPAPVKANLGEETSFYYDKELKRWVNKKAGAETPKAAAPPPPPSRAQTASPGRSMQPSISGPPPASPMPPHGRPSSAMNASSSAPPKRNHLPPVRSNLVPDESSAAPLSAPPMPAVMSSLSATPPTGRPKSAAKRSARSRYVDAFQQPS